MTAVDLNDTPLSNVFSEVVKGDAWLAMTALEKSVMRAEKKLRIAVETLKSIEQMGTTYDQHTQQAHNALEEIERVI